MAPTFGTTLIVGYTPDGIVMAADDLGHSKEGGKAIPREIGIEKVFVLDRNIVGSTGLMRHAKIKYKFEEWISTFIQTHYDALTDKHPRDVTAALEKEMRHTFHDAEAFHDDEIGKANSPIKQLVRYVVAGYSEDSILPYIFEFGAGLSADRRKIEYVPTLQYRTQNPVIFGEEYFLRRAQKGFDPERSCLESIMVSLNVGATLWQISTSLQRLTSDLIGLIKVEAKFNSNKVGSTVRVGILDATTGTHSLATF
jgi:hypothetical protein